MGQIKSYRIDGNDLYLEEFNDWWFATGKDDSVQVWKLINVDKTDITTGKAAEIVADGGDMWFDIEELNKRKRVKVYDEYEDIEYFFHCDDVTATLRPYSTDELSEIIVNHMRNRDEQNDKIVKQKHALEEIEKFILKEIDKKQGIVEELADATGSAVMKAKYLLDVLNQLKSLFDKEQANINRKTTNGE